MNFGCDIYLYEHVGGFWSLNVAGNRVVGDVPKLPNIMQASTDAFMVAYRAQMDYLDTAKRERIDHPAAGETFELSSIEDVIAKLEELGAAGFRFPADLIPLLKEELADEEAAASEPTNNGPDHEE